MVSLIAPAYRVEGLRDKDLLSALKKISLLLRSKSPKQAPDYSVSVFLYDP